MSSGKKNFGEYYLGLDVGTNSVGWCVTDVNYNVLKTKGKALWGVRLFDAAESAAERRSHRCSRRRLRRRNWRVKLVRSLFKSEITKVDSHFFMRLDESKFQKDDKKDELKKNTPESCIRFSLFANPNSEDKACRTDRDFYREYPTIYHLRETLMKHGEENDGQKFDIRLYYLVISHFMKHRGYFYQDLGDSEKPDIKSIFEYLNRLANEEGIGVELNVTSIEDFQKILFDKDIETDSKKKMITKLLENPLEDQKEIIEAQKEVIKAICGLKFNMQILFCDTSNKELKKNFSFENNDIENLNIERNRIEYLSRLYELYRYSYFDRIKEGYSTISASQKARYEENRRIINGLKNNVKDIESNKIKSLKRRPIPYRVNLKDLELVLNSLIKDYPTFNVKDPEGYSDYDKILETFKFQIPYYVGPLSMHYHKNENSWIVRKKGNETRKIFPWNFDKIVDRERSAEEFLKRMLRDCQKLYGEKVVPKNSLLYSKYMVLNELNNIRIDGKRIPTDTKQKIYKGFFKGEEGRKYKSKNIKLDVLKKWLLTDESDEREERITNDITLSGVVDNTFQSSLKSYHDFKDIIGEKVDKYPLMVEDMIRDILVFGNDRDVLRKRIIKDANNILTEEQIDAISRLSYSGWGSFSREFLDGDVKNEMGQTIIEALYASNENLEELMSQKHTFQTSINEFNRGKIIEKQQQFLSYQKMCEIAKRFYPSPSVKRSVWQSLLIVNEIRKICGNDPSRIFIEFAREKEKNPQLKSSRKVRFLELYNNILKDCLEYNDEAERMIKFINGIEDPRRFRAKKLYLYISQMGKDIYTGKPISQNDISSGVYNIDHIIPQALKKDDSIENNLVLTSMQFNQNEKKAVYPIDKSVVKEQKSWWGYLRKYKLISDEKYRRLIRSEELNPDEKISFINRQLVETRQSTKLLKELLEASMPSSKVICTRASLISEFRKDNYFWKSRLINDYHHAKDAYLNIVVGNVYTTLFSEPWNIVKTGKTYSLRMKSIFKYEVNNHGVVTYNLRNAENYKICRGSRIVWRGSENGTIATVREWMSKNNILFTRYACKKCKQGNGFWDQQPLAKRDGILAPLKTIDKRYIISKYGGYKNRYNSFALVESSSGKNKKRSIERLPNSLKNSSIDKILDYLKDNKGANLANPVIIIPTMKINSLLKIDGVPSFISGSYDKKEVLLKNAVQLIVDSKTEEIIYRIESFMKKYKMNTELKIDKNYDRIEPNDLLYVFNVLVRKINSNIYSLLLRPKETPERFQNCEIKFKELKIEEQCAIIDEMLKIFRCENIRSDNEDKKFKDMKPLKLLGIDDGFAYKISKNISTQFKSIKLINQSVTGIFESERDLLTCSK